jgi:hypothetical protein
VEVKGLKKSRRGKHHDLMGKIMEDLRNSQPGFAVQIPLNSIDTVSVLNLRSAIVRAAAKENIKVSRILLNAKRVQTCLFGVSTWRKTRP